MATAKKASGVAKTDVVRLADRQQASDSAPVAAPSRWDGMLELAHMIKAIRTEVRLKHSLAADTELNHMYDGLLPKARKLYWQHVTGGKEMSYAILKKLLGMS